MMTRILSTVLVSILWASTAWGGLNQDIEQQLHRVIGAALVGQDARISIRDWRLREPVLLNEALSVKDIEIMRGDRAVGLVNMRVRFNMPQAKVVSTTLLAEVEAKVPVWVVARRMGRGAPLNGVNVRVEERPLSRLGRNTVRATESLVGKVSSRPLSPGMLLSSSAVTTPMLVTKGQDVSVAVHVGSVRVQTRGEAMGNGRRGDHVSVRLHGSRRVLKVEVIGRNQASVIR